MVKATARSAELGNLAARRRLRPGECRPKPRPAGAFIRRAAPPVRQLHGSVQGVSDRDRKRPPRCVNSGGRHQRITPPAVAEATCPLAEPAQVPRREARPRMLDMAGAAPETLRSRAPL